MQYSVTKLIRHTAVGIALAGLLLADEALALKPSSAHSASAQSLAHPELWPVVKSKIQKDAKMEQTIAKMVKGMTTEQKVAQMIQPEIRSFTPEDMRKYGFGSFLNGGGAFPNNNKYATMADWVALADTLYNASIDDALDGSRIPALWGTDAVHGHNNVIGATLFPHNIALGAANNPRLIKAIGEATARAVAVTGIDWVFAPTLAVVRDDRWGRTYEGYSEDPIIVKAYAGAMVEGLQGSAGKNFLDEAHVLATAKHFLGDGGTHAGDDQGNNLATENDLLDIHGPGYIASLHVGVQTVMASFNSWHGKKMHGNKSLLSGVLKERMGFDGLVVGDWNGHGQIDGCSNSRCATAINAGVDIIMVPDDWKLMLENTLEQVASGEIPMARIDDAVTRILRVKMRAGLFEKGAPSTRGFAGKSEYIGAQEHRDLAQQAVRESLVLLKNKGNLLPLSRALTVLVAGDGADDIGKASGGWSLSWQGTGNTNADFPGATSIYAGIESAVQAAGGSASLSVEGDCEEKPDVAIVVFGETPYAEGVGDLANLEYQRGSKQDLELLKKLKKQGIPVVSVFITGRPMWVNKELNASDAFVVAWLPGSEGQGVADLLFKNENGKTNHDFNGKLSFSWPNLDTQTAVNRFDKGEKPLFPYGYGLTYRDTDSLGDRLSEVSDPKAKGAGDDELYLFTSRALHGFSLFLGDRENWAVPVTGSIASTQGSDNLKIKSVNWKVQEDARQLSWSGKGAAQVFLKSPENNNFTQLLNRGAAISYDLRVDRYPTAEVYSRIDCDQPCLGELAIADELKSRTLGEWKNFSIDLQCFAEAGADFSNISSPWVIYSAGALGLSFANIKIVPGAGAEADISCSKAAE